MSCKTPSIPALIVTVVGPSGTLICDATVTASDGDFSARLAELSDAAAGTCHYFGPYNRAGDYTIVVHVGAATVVRRGLKPRTNACNVLSLPVEIKT